MLEGLEISVLNLSDVLDDNKTKRFDSEFFKKEYLEIDNNISSNEYKRLLTLCEKITDFGAFSQNNFIEYKEEGNHYFIRNQDIENSFIKDDKIFIEKDVYEKLSLKLNEFDLLLQRTGSIGKSGLVLKKDLPSSANQNLAQIKPNLTKINPYFLNVFLNSLIGQKIFERLATGNVQPWLNLGQIESIKIPSFSEKNQLKIEKLVKESQNGLNTSKQTYSQAENLLLQEIGFADYKASIESVNVKNFSDSFRKSCRLDAEYYSKVSEDLILKIKNNQFELLGNICTIRRGNFISKTFYTEDKKGTCYLRGGDFSSNHIKDDKTIFVSNKFNPSNEYRTEVGDILIALIGSVGTLGIVTDKFADSYISNNIGIIKITDKQFLTEYIHLFLTSSLGKILFDKIEMRTAQPKISDKDIYEFPIPKLDIKKQQQIADLVEQSFALKKKSEQLLEVAKKAVELAIEENEELALNYINQETNE